MHGFVNEPQYIAYTETRRRHWDAVAEQYGEDRRAAKYYHSRLAEVYSSLVPPKMRVLEIGCGQGDLLASLSPGFGVGLDFSPKMIDLATERHDSLEFILADAHSLPVEASFDVVILSDLLNDVWDVEVVLSEVRRVCHPGTRILINIYNRIWEPILSLAAYLGLARPNLLQNWLTIEDLENLLYLSDSERIRTWPEIIIPFQFPWLTSFLNKFLVRLWPFHHLALTHILVSRPSPGDSVPAAEKLSIVIPARNEAGNIAEIFDRMPDFPIPFEIVFVEGHSSDNTYDVIDHFIENETGKECKLLRQEGEGKGDAVRLGFEHSEGDIFVILDADLTVPPEDLPRFIEALLSGKAEFANGVRLVYPMQNEAMRFANLVGNKFFSLAFSWVLGQPIKDTLCGTKAIWRKDYENIVAHRGYFGEIDPFGDFDLILGAAKLNLKILDLPVRYRTRTYGSTNISRWRHGLLLVRMLITAASKLKFI